MAAEGNCWWCWWFFSCDNKERNICRYSL